MLRSLRLAALPALLAPVLLLGPAQASASGTAAAAALPDPTTVSAKVPVTDGPAGRHRSFSLDTTLYVPKGASATSRRPAIVMTNGFGLDKTAAEVRSMATYLARHGYLVLTYSAAGFGASGGCISLQSADFDAKSTSQLITKVLGPRTDVLRDGKGMVVGTVGGSYGGGGQLVLAGLDPRIRAAAPGRTWNLLRYSLDPNNRVVPGDPTGFDHELNAQGVFKAEWSSLFFASGNEGALAGAGGCSSDPDRAGPTVPVPCPGFIGDVCETFARITSTGDTTAVDRRLLDRASGDTFLRSAKIPVLLVQGQRDTLFNVNDALATYTDLRRAGTPVKMIWNSGGHGGYDSLPGECEVYGSGTGGTDFRGLEGCYLTSRTLAFFDAALRGKVDPSPGFTWFRDQVPYDGDGSADERYGAAPAYPAMPSRTYTLSGSSALVPPGATALLGSASFVNPPGALPGAPVDSYSETSNFSGPNSSPRDPRDPYDVPGQSVSFTTPRFATSFESVGVPSAHLRLSHTNGSDLVLFGKVFDVAPDGTATLVHRLISPVRVPAAAVGAPLDLKLIGFAHRFAAGHAARLVLASTDATSRTSQVPDPITVTSGPGSTFSLPMPKAARASAAPVGTGSAGSGTPGASGAATVARGRAVLAATGPDGPLPLAGLLALAGAAAVIRRSTA